MRGRISGRHVCSEQETPSRAGGRQTHLRSKVGYAERSRDGPVVLELFEDPPELDEFALGRHERVVHEQEVRLASEAGDRGLDRVAQVLEGDTGRVRVASLGRD